jgi:acyl carrier protein
VTADEVLKTIADVIAAHFETGEPVTRQTTAFDVDGWDSLAHFVFIVKLEKVFGIKATDHIRHGCADVGELADAIHALIAAR